MQLRHVGDSRYQVQAPGGIPEHIRGLEQVLGSLSTTEDLILHCQNKSIIRTNKMPLFFNSKLFVKLLTETCHCPSALTQEYDIICPDFDPDSMARVLELITTGATNLDAVDGNVYKGMLFIIDTFQINIKLEEIWSNVQTTKLKIQKDWRTSKMSNYVSRSTTDDSDSALFDSSSQRMDEIKKSYSCQVCNKEFQLLLNFKKHMKQHLDLVTVADPAFELHVTDQEEEVSKEKLATCSEMKDVVDTKMTHEIDSNNIFFCYECSTELKSFESFEKHMDHHFMEIDNAATSQNIPTDCKTKREDSDEYFRPDDGKTIDKTQEKKRNVKDLLYCPICHTTQTKLSHLLVHVGSQHFKKQIVESYGAQYTTTCNKCERTFPDKGHLLSHIVLLHRALKYIAPNDVYLKLESMRAPYARGKEKKRNSVSKISCNSRPSTTYNCTLCEKKGLGYKNFLYHFGKKHYMCLLKKVHKGMTSCCGKCAKMHSDDNKLIGHLIIEHGALKEELKGGYLTT